MTTLPTLMLDPKQTSGASSPSGFSTSSTIPSTPESPSLCMSESTLRLCLDRTESMEEFRGLPHRSELTVGAFLGQGPAAEVFQTPKGAKAVKVIDMKKSRKLGLESSPSAHEYRMHHRMDRATAGRKSQIVKWYEGFLCDGKMCLTFEYCAGGDLCKYVETTGAPLTEPQAASIMRQLFRGLDFLHHEVFVAHRDIKPKNILLVDHEDMEIRICDFGAACDYSKSPMQYCVGTDLYMAPEVGGGNYSYLCDIWSSGMVMLYLLCGKDSNAATQMDVLKTIEEMPSNQISPDAKDLLRHLLQIDPQKRYTSNQALEHRWLND